MKKTLTANISGTVFHIEEDAYDLMTRYLANIRSKFTGSVGADEIISDIESRIAELFTERLVGRQVVTVADVEHVIGVMGQPEDYLDDEAQGAGAGAGAGAGTGASFNGPRKRRLYRHPEDLWLGGVFGGIAAYFNTDPLWFRIAFIVFVILGVGSPILIYVILWILVPVAETPAERLMMEGEPVTVDNLKRAFEEGATRFQEGAERVAKEANDLGRRWSAPSARQRQRAAASSVEAVFRRIFSVFGRVIGVFLLILGTGFTLALLSLLITGGSITMNASPAGTDLHAFSAALFESPEQGFWAVTSVVLLLLVPAIGVFLGGLRLAADVNTPRWLGWTLSAAWIAALVTVLFIVPRLVNDFKRTRTLSTEVVLVQPVGQTLTLDLMLLSGMGHDEVEEKRWGVGYRHGQVDLDLEGFVIGDSMSLDAVGVDVEPSPDSLFHIVAERSAQGNTTKAALNRAEHIVHHSLQARDTLKIAPEFHAPLDDKYRAQRLRLVVQVPVGRAVHFGTAMGFLLDDVDNVTNTLDDDMVGKTWTMTSGGLSNSVTPEQVPDDLPSPLVPPTAPIAPSSPQPAPAPAEDQRPSVALPNLFLGLTAFVRN